MFSGKKYVYEVYKEKSFTKAAQKLYISQPSLSERIKKIEDKIGYPLFDRSTNPLQLTEVGSLYIELAEEIFQIEQRFEKHINSLNALQTGSLAIGASNLFAAYAIAPLAAKLRARFPNIHIGLTEENTARLELLLKRNLLDFVIDNHRYDESIYNRQFYCEENILLAVPVTFGENSIVQEYQLSQEDIKKKRYLDASCPCVPLNVFADSPFVMLASGNDTQIRGIKLCKAAGFHPNVILELSQQSTAYMTAAKQMGATFISDILVRQLPSFENLVYYKLKGEAAHRQVFIYFKRHKFKTRAMEEFLDMIAKQNGI